MSQVPGRAPRTLAPTAFPDDDGGCDPTLAAALAVFHQTPARAPEVVHALAGARLLVPVVARLVEAEAGDGGLRREKATAMAIASLVGADGRRALPVFSSLAAMAAWDPRARPVPVSAAQAALSAASDGAQLLVLDVAGPATLPLGGDLLRRLAEGDELRPVYDDPVVASAVARLLARHRDVVAASLVPAEGADARLCLSFEPALPAADLAAAAARVAADLRVLPELRAATVHGLDLAVLEPGDITSGGLCYLRAESSATSASPSGTPSPVQASQPGPAA